MFVITDCKCVHLPFSNGLTLSTQFGYGDYCDNHDMREDSKMQVKIQSRDAKIAIWDKKGIWVTRQVYEETGNKEISDDVVGYVEMEEWLEIVDWCRKYKQEKVIKGDCEE